MFYFFELYIIVIYLFVYIYIKCIFINILMYLSTTNRAIWKDHDFLLSHQDQTQEVLIDFCSDLASPVSRCAFDCHTWMQIGHLLWILFRHMDVIEEVRLFFASEIMIMTYSWHERRGTNIAFSFLTLMRMPWWSAGALSKRTLETWWMFLAERYMQHVLNTRNRTAGLWKSIKVYCINRTFLISSDLRPSPWVKMWKNSAASRNFAICLFKARPFQDFSCPFWSFGSGFDLT